MLSSDIMSRDSDASRDDESLEDNDKLINFGPGD